MLEDGHVLAMPPGRVVIAAFAHNSFLRFGVAFADLMLPRVSHTCMNAL